MCICGPLKIPYSKVLCSTLPYLPNPTQETRSPDLPRFLKIERIQENKLKSADY